MLLSQKLNMLRETVNSHIGFDDELADGFNRAIQDAEFMEERESISKEIKEESRELLAYLVIHGGIEEVEGQLIVSRLNEAINR